MSPFSLFMYYILLWAGCNTAQRHSNNWIPLFDGKSLNGWKVNENPATFRADSGMIIVHGNRSHLFYEGPVMNHNFKNFELKVQLMTRPGANSGIFFHTEFQNSGWPQKGYEVQVNNSHTDWKRSGSLYDVANVREVYVKDNEWYTEHIIVQGKRIIVKINDKTVVDYTEPENIAQQPGREWKHLSSGTFALQGHDPNSTVYYKEILVKPLPG